MKDQRFFDLFLKAIIILGVLDMALISYSVLTLISLGRYSDDFGWGIGIIIFTVWPIYHILITIVFSILFYLKLEVNKILTTIKFTGLLIIFQTFSILLVLILPSLFPTFTVRNPTHTLSILIVYFIFYFSSAVAIKSILKQLA